MSAVIYGIFAVSEVRELVKEKLNYGHFSATGSTATIKQTRGQSNLTKGASRGANSPVRGRPRGSKVAPLDSWGRVSY